MKQDSEHQAKQQYIKILQYCSSELNGNGQIYDRSGAKKKLTLVVMDEAVELFSKGRRRGGGNRLLQERRPVKW